MKIAIVSSDNRLQQVYKNLSMDFKTVLIDETTDFNAIVDIDVLVFPVKGCDALGYLSFGEKQIKIPSLFWTQLDPNARIITGMRNQFLDKQKQPKLYYMEDKNVVRENALLTTEGILALLIEHTKRSIFELKIDIIGYGNCGKSIYEVFRNLGLQVRVLRRECKHTKEFCPLANWMQCGDVIINTSVQCVIDKERIHTWEKKPLIIDIATPDVIDTRTAKEVGITVLKAGNLPGRFASESAGDIIADFVRGKLNEK